MPHATSALTIEDDIKSLHAEKLSRDDFLRRLAEQFVYVAVNPGRANGRFEVVTVSATGEDGMFLPVFTTEERFRATPLATHHEPLLIPFDEIMRQVRSDTGLILNPGTDHEYMFRSFILQEYIDDFGQAFVKHEATPEWLQQINADFIATGTPHGQRTWKAISIWSDANGLPINMFSPRAKRIQAWFRENINPVSDSVGPIAAAAFFYDTSFWEVTIPLCYGSPSLNPLDMLRMKASVKARLAEENEKYVYLKFFADTYDYFYTVEDVLPTLSSKPLLANFIGAGRAQIKQAASLLLGQHPNPKAAEAARFALEMFLKTFLIARGLTESELKDKFKHHLDRLLAKCLEFEPASPLRALEPKLPLYPDVSARYRTDVIAPRDLWNMYYAAQSAGAIVMRPMSNRDIASTFRITP